MSPLRALRSFRFSRLQLKVLGIVAASMAVAVVVAIAALTRVYGTAKDLERISGQDFQAQVGIVRAELAFKAQTQEWKNVLLRGANPQMLSVHWDAFVESEKLAQRLASDAKDSTQHPEVVRALEAFAQGHAEAGEAYRRARRWSSAATSRGPTRPLPASIGVPRSIWRRPTRSPRSWAPGSS